LTSLGIGILGDKGIGKAGTIAKTVRQAGKGEKPLPIYTPVQTPAVAVGLAQGPVPYNVLNDPLTKIKTVTDDVFGAKGMGNPKKRLPRNNGHWKGEPGNGKWYSDKPEVKKITNGEGVEFKEGRPNFTPWSEGDLEFGKGQLSGTIEDFSLVYEHIKTQYNLPSKNAAKKLLKQAGVTPHHKSETVIELIPTDLHKNVPHIGSASDLRGGY
jgi:hypothetical protein